MNVQTWQRVRALFDTFIELAPEVQTTKLEQLLLGEDAAERDLLRQEVLSMLAADALQLMRTQLDDQAPEMLSSLAQDDRDAQHQLLTNQRIGAFSLVRELGRGGMGTVWLAERVDGEFTQQVAIKLIRPGWHTTETLSRFRAERQILAGLKHPNIAHLIDGGVTEDGRPWLALDYVEGVDIRTFCDQHKLDLSQRLRLFNTVCDAVSYAHSRLVVHRDLKPSNIMVTQQGEVKLLDFGIAKLLASEHTQISQARHFTPEYAAPEQVLGEAMTTSVDVYALGLLLYELLTAKRAFETDKSTPAAYEHAILHEQARAPSRTAVEGIEAVERANCFALTPAALSARLRGDLDAIVAKALRKEPEQRYASVAALAEDLQRHLALQPVMARRGAWRYRAGRFLRRHALVAGLASLALTAVLAGSVFSLWQASIARAERDRAQTALATAESVTSFLTDLLAKATPDAGKGKELSVREALDLAAADLDKKFGDQPQVRARIQMLLGQVYNILGAEEKSEVQLRAGLALIIKLHGENSMEVTDALSLLANTLSNRGALDEAHTLIMRAYAIASKVQGANAEQTLWLLSEIGVSAYERGKYNEAATAFAAALDGLRKLPNANPRAIANVLHNHAAALTRAERYAEAEAAHMESLAIRRRLFTDPHTNIAVGLHQIGVTKAAQKQYTEAARYFNEARAQYVILVGPDHENVLSEDLSLARLEVDQEHFDTAIALLRPLLERYRTLLGSEHEDTAICAVELADALQHKQQNAQAQAFIGPAIAVLEKAYPEGHSVLAAALRVKFALQKAEGQADCALANRFANMFLRSFGPTHSRVRAAQTVARECVSAKL